MRIYQRSGSPFWWYDFAANGHRYRGSTGETAERKAQIAAHEALQRARATPPPSKIWTVSMTLGTWYDQHATETASGDAIWSNIQNLERCLDVSLPLDKLDHAALITFRAKRRGEGVSGPTINRDLAYLQAACRFAHFMHGQPLPAIQWTKMKYPENPHRVRFAAHEEFGAMQAIEDAELADIIFAAVSTGVRRGNLKWKWYQVDLPPAGDKRRQHGTVTIPRTKGRVPIVIRLSAAMVAMLRRRRTAAIDAVGIKDLAQADVFMWKNFRKRWEKLRADLKLIDFRWHDLRHTFGTWARKSGVDLLKLKDAMAHKDIKTTMRYAHIEPDEAATTFDLVAERMAQLSAHAKKKQKKSAS